MESLGALLPFVLILLAFYVLIIRPARKRQGAQNRLQGSLQAGQQIMTTSGLYAEIVAIEEDAVVLETSRGVTQRWAKAAVARVLTETVTDPTSVTDTGGDTVAEHGTETSTVDPDATGKRSD